MLLLIAILALILMVTGTTITANDGTHGRGDFFFCLGLAIFAGILFIG